jgi:NADPH:quinone reductase-like Zn-dependent oxidoreductase
VRFSLGGKGDHRSYGGCLVGGVVSIATVVTLLEVLMNRSIAVIVCAPESTLVIKPDNVTFEQAASVPVAAFTEVEVRE